MSVVLDNISRADGGLVAVDTETTGIDGIKDGRHYCVGISIAYRIAGNLFSEYVPIRHSNSNFEPKKVEQLRDALVSCSTSNALIFHNSKFDIHSLATLGNDWRWLFERGRFFDTLAVAHMFNEELPSKQLDWLSKHFLNDNKDKDRLAQYTKIFGWDDVPVDLMAPYARKDAELTYRLWEVLWPQLKREEMDVLWPREMEFIRTLSRLERNGLRFIPLPALEMLEQGTKRLQEIENEYGFELSKTNELKRLFLDELKMPVVEYTCGCAVGWDDTNCKKGPERHGKPSINKAALIQYEEMLEFSNNPIAGRVLEYRGWQKAVSSWYEAFPGLCGADGRIRTTFNIHGTRTSRLSSEKPNLQQLPRSTNKPWNNRVRECFGPAEEFTLVKFDFSTLELRLAADYCNITPMLDGFTQGISPHRVTQEQLGIAYNDAKNTNFAMLYLAGARKLAWMLGYRLPDGSIDEAKGKAIWDGFRESYPGFREVASMASQRAKSRGHIRYWSGRRKHYNYFNKGEEHKAFNALIQGGGAEIVKSAILNCNRIECDDARPVLTVHDEYDWEIRTSRLNEFIPAIVDAMQKPPDNSNFRVKFEVEHSFWGAKE